MEEVGTQDPPRAERIAAALKKADAAGDVEGAKKLAAAYREEMGMSTPSPGKSVAPPPQQPPVLGGGGGAAPTGSDTPSAPSQPPSAPESVTAKPPSGTDRGVLFRNYWNAEGQARSLNEQFRQAQENAASVEGLGGMQPKQEAEIGRLSSLQSTYAKAARSSKGVFDRELDATVKEVASAAPLTMDKDGIQYADPTKVMAVAKGVASQYGIQDPEFEKVVYDRLLAHVDTGIIEKDAERRFEEKAKPVMDAEQLRMKGLFKTDSIEYAKAKSFIDASVASANAGAKQDIDALAVASKQQAEAVNASLEQAAKQYEQQVARVQAAASSGAIPQEQAQQQLDALYQAYQQQFGEAQTAIGGLNAKAASEVRSINQRYNRRFQEEQRRILEGAERRIDAAAEKFAKEYGSTPEGMAVRDRLRELQGEAWGDAAEARGKKIEAVSDARFLKQSLYGNVLGAMTARFGESVVEGLGGSFKGIAANTGNQSLYLLGEEMHRAFVLPETKSDSFSDLLDAQNFAQSTGQLVGGMLPSLAASTAAAAATGGASIPVQMLAAGAAGWGAETLDISGRARDDMYRNTGSREKADDAGWKSFVGQVQLMPAYAFEGLPFVGKALDFIPTKALRMGAAAGTEYGTELLQEIPQSIAEQNILRGKDAYEDFWQGLSSMEQSGDLKRLLVTMAPISLLGAGGQVTRKSQKQALEDAVKAYVAKGELSKYVEGAAGQWINRMIADNGKNFSSAVIASMQEGAQIDEATATELIKLQEQVLRARDESSRIGLGKKDTDIYTALSLQMNALRAQAEAEQSPAAKAVADKRAKEIEQSLTDFANEGKRQYVEVGFADKTSLLMDRAAAMRALKDPRFIVQAAMQGDALSLDFQGDEMEDLVADFQGSVMNVSDAIEKAKQRAAEGPIAAPAEVSAILMEAANKPPQIPIADDVDPEVRDEMIRAREALGVRYDPLNDLPEKVTRMFDRIEADKPVDAFALDEVSDWLYGKYKEVVKMRSDPKRLLTLEQIDSYAESLGEAITTVENYKTKLKENAAADPKPKEAQPEGKAAVVAVAEEPRKRKRPKNKRQPRIKINGAEIAPGEETVEGAVTPEAATEVQPTVVEDVSISEPNDTGGVLPSAASDVLLQRDDAPVAETPPEVPPQAPPSVPVQERPEVASTPVRDAFNAEVEALDATNKRTDTENISVGDYISIPPSDNSSGLTGIVRKVGPVNIEVETTYGGYADSDVTLMTIKAKKGDVKAFISKKPEVTGADIPLPFELPATIPKDGYTPEAQEYVNEWGTTVYSNKSSAAQYAKRLEAGEGGTWVAEKVGKKWRAHRTDLAPKRMQAEFEAASAERKKQSAEEARALSEEFDARQEAFLAQYPEAEADLERTEEKIAAGTPLTPKEVAIANENLFRPEGYDFDESGGIVKATSKPKKEKPVAAAKQTAIPEAPAKAEAPLPKKEDKASDAPKPVAPEQKSLADKLDSFADDLEKKIKGAAGSFIIPPQVAVAAVRIAAKAIRAGATVSNAIAEAIAHLRNSDWYKGLKKGEQKQAEEQLSEQIASVVEPQEKAAPKKDSKGVKKTLATVRAYEGEFREEVKAELEKSGLYRSIENQQEAKASADAFIAKVGITAALEAARNGDIRGGARTVIRIRAAEALDRAYMEETDPARLAEIALELSELTQEFSRLYTEGGQESAMLNLMYEESDLGFKSEVKAQEWEKQFGERPSDQMMAKWKERDKELDELKQQLADAQKRAEEAEEKATITAIEESIARDKAKNRTYTQKAKVVADKFRKLKGKPMTFTDADGNRIDVTQMGFDWNALVELGAKAIEKTGQLADGIAAIAEYLKNAAWFAALDDRNKAAIMQQVEDAFDEVNEEDVGDGRIRIPKQMIRAAVEAGAKDINTLVAVIKEQIREDYPDATDREIRDAITDYGKVVNMNRDDISTEIRRMRRMGRILSALEDVQNKKRPLRSGLQRDKLDAEERALNKQLKDAMKDLPVDAEAQQQELRTALDAAKTRARNRIEDLQREIDTKELIQRNTKQVVPDAELKALIAEKDALQEEHDRIFEDKAATEQERLNRAIDAARRSVEKYRQRIADRNLDPTKPSPVKETPELRAERENLERAKAEYKLLQEEAGVIERKRLETAKKIAQGRIEDLRRRLDDGDFSRKATKPVVADTELVKLNARKIRLKEEYEKEFYKHKLESRTPAEKAKDFVANAWNLPRAAMATAEWSFVLMQGGALTISNLLHKPDAVGRAFKNMWRAMGSEQRSANWLQRVKAQEWYPTAKEAKLAITEPHGEATAREELFFSDWTKMIWNALGSPLLLVNKAAHQRWALANPFRAIERGSVAYLDTLRVERFLDGMAMLEKNKAAGKEVTKQDYRDVADAINTLTGRASLGVAEPIAKGLTKVFFSPRLWASSIKTATPYALYHFGRMTPTARKMAIQDMGRFVGTTMAFVAAAALHFNNDDDDETGVEMDPRSSDFGKIKIGNTRIDPWGGRMPQLVFSARLIARIAGMDAYKSNKGQVMPLGVRGKSPTLFDAALDMAMNKLNPAASFVTDWARAEERKDGKLYTKYGQEYDMSDEALERLTPIYFGSVSDLMKEDPGALEGFLLFYAFFGGGVQIYEPKKKKGTKSGSSSSAESLLKDLQDAKK